MSEHSAEQPLAVADFHLHTSASHDCTVEPAEVVRLAVARGLTAIAICDHGTIAGAIEARTVAAETDAGVLVVVGEEIRSAEGEIIGLFLESPIDTGMSPEETVIAIKAQHGLVCVPHPFDRMRRSPLTRGALDRIAADIDVIEAFNARNLRRADNEAAAAWAEVRGIAKVAGSDAHTRGEIGNVFVELPAFADATGLLSAVRSATIHTRGAGVFPHVATAWTKRVRRRV